MGIRLLALTGLSVVVSALIGGGDPTTRPGPTTTRATSAPSAMRLRVARLVSELGSARFQGRESAQRQLEGLGGAAMPFLVEHINDPDPEVAARVSALIRSPRDPALRVDVAVRLLETCHPDWMERAVFMLFEEPAEVCDAFIARAGERTGVHGAVFGAVAERFESWKRQDEVFNRHYERIRRKNPEGAARLLEMHRGGFMYEAEAAYHAAVEALLDHRGGKERASRAARPASRPTTPAIP